MQSKLSASGTSPLNALAQLAVKDGVTLGGLAPDAQTLALAVAWAALPVHGVTEREVNEALRAALAGPACWLATDHVELRRWLVDGGWLQRDGYGRVYQRKALPDLRPEQRLSAATVASLDLAPWVSAQRQRHADARAARWQVWKEQRQAA